MVSKKLQSFIYIATMLVLSSLAGSAQVPVSQHVILIIEENHS